MPYVIRRTSEDVGTPDTSTISGFVLQALRDWRLQGNSIFRMSKELGIPRERLYCYANGRRPVLPQSMQDRIAKYLGVRCYVEKPHGGASDDLGADGRRSAEAGHMATGASGKAANGARAQTPKARRSVQKARR